MFGWYYLTNVPLQSDLFLTAQYGLIRSLSETLLPSGET